MKHTFIACIAGIALLAPAPGVLAAQGAEAIRHAASGGRGMQAGSKIHLRQIYDSDASSLVGMFIPDDVPADAVSEGKAFRSACDQYLVRKEVRAGGKFEDVVLQGNTARRIEYTVTGKLTADIQKTSEFQRCCKASPGQCPRRYIDSVLKGELFDRTSADGRESIRETQGEQYFGYTIALLPQNIGALTHCDAQHSWARNVPVSVNGTYFVGAAFGGRSAALNNARDQASAHIVQTMTAAKTEIEKSMGTVALGADDMAELTDLAKRMAGNLENECWADESGKTFVLALLSSETLEASRQAALNFYASRTQGAVASALDRAVQKLIDKLSTGTGIRHASIGAIDDRTAQMKGRGKGKAIGSALPSARSEWLTHQLAAALSRRPGDFILGQENVPAASGPNESVVIKGTITARGRELIVSLTASVTNGRGKAPRLVQLDEIAIPEVTAPKNEAPQKLTLKIAKSPDGTLCAGQTTSITVSTDEKRYVQIWNLYGPSCENAVLIYPAEEGEGFVTPNTPLVLSDMTALPTRGSTRECFIAVAGASRDALGELGRFSGCRLSAKQAKKLLDKGALRQPARNLEVADDDYVLSNDGCAPVDEAAMTENEAALKNIPLCR